MIVYRCIVSLEIHAVKMLYDSMLDISAYANLSEDAEFLLKLLFASLSQLQKTLGGQKAYV